MDFTKGLYVSGICLTAAVGLYIFWGPTTEKRRPRRKGVCGLRNLGYTCFLNTLLQSLASCPMMIDWLEEQEKNDQKETVLAPTLLYGLQVLNNTVPYEDDVFSPYELIQALKRHGWLLGQEEQDAHEMFVVLLSTLDDEIKKAMHTTSLLDVSQFKSQADNKSLLLSNTLLKATSMVQVLEDKEDLRNVPMKMDIRNGKATAILENGVTNCHPVTECDDLLKSASDTNELPKKSRQFGGSCLSLQETSSTIVYCANGVLGRTFSPLVIKQDLTRQWKSPFRGLLTSQLTCNTCKTNSGQIYDTFDTLSLLLPPVRHGHIITLHSLLKTYVSQENLTDVICDNCTKLYQQGSGDHQLIKRTFTKQLYIGKLPRCLCIHIHRTAMMSNGQTYKRTDHVDFPEYLCADNYTYTNHIKDKMSESESNESSTVPTLVNGEEDGSTVCDILHLYNLPTNEHMYILKAVIVHVGDVISGHFVTYRRGPIRCTAQQNKWFYTSDALVHKSSIIEVLNSKAYMLFYERV